MIENLSLAEIVKSKPETAALLEKYDLDFCCKGKMKLSDQVKDPDRLKDIIGELEIVFSKGKIQEVNYEELSLTALVDHILQTHHTYVKEVMPLILLHLEKVAAKHGDRFPYMKRILALFFEVKHDLEQHLVKEEMILFPQIKLIEAEKSSGKNPETPFRVDMPILVMEEEHEVVGKLMQEIRLLSNHYTAPEGACMTFMVSLDELKKFEEDLHIHVHLENFILFPKAIRLQNDLSDKV